MTAKPETIFRTRVSSRDVLENTSAIYITPKGRATLDAGSGGEMYVRSNEP